MERTKTIRLSLKEWKILNTRVRGIYKLLGFNHPMSKEGITLPISQNKWVKVNVDYVFIYFASGKTVERRLSVVFAHDDWVKLTKRVTVLISNT